MLFSRGLAAEKVVAQQRRRAHFIVFFFNPQKHTWYVPLDAPSSYQDHFDVLQRRNLILSTGRMPRRILKFWLLTGLTLSNWFWVLCACYLGLKQPWFKFRCGLPWERVLGWLPCYSHAGDSSERFGLHRSQCCVHAVEKVYCWIRSRNQCCVHAIFDSTKTSRWEQRSSMVKPLYKCTRHVRRWVRHSCRHSHVHTPQSLIHKLRKQKKKHIFF